MFGFTLIQAIEFFKRFSKRKKPRIVQAPLSIVKYRSLEFFFLDEVDVFNFFSGSMITKGVSEEEKQRKSLNAHDFIVAAHEFSYYTFFYSGQVSRSYTPVLCILTISKKLEIITLSTL